jgi:hypothetical protein
MYAKDTGSGGHKWIQKGCQVKRKKKKNTLWMILQH